MSSVAATIDNALDPEPWPKLIAFDDDTDLPKLDAKLLPTWLGDYAHALSSSVETPPELAIGLTLAVASTCTARRLIVECKPGYREPTNLWIVVALEPGNRKSSIEGKAKAPLVDWEICQAERLAPEIADAISRRKSMEARVKSLRTAAAKPSTKPADAEKYRKELSELQADLPKVPSEPRLWTSDATPERIGTLLAENGECLSMLSSEGGIFDLLGGRYSGGVPNLDLVLKAHAGDSDRVDRLSRGSVQLTYPRITMGLSPQPDVLCSLANQPGFVGRGLLARFLWLQPTSPLGFRTNDTPPLCQTAATQYSAGIAAMLNWPEPSPGECHVLKLDDNAFDEWGEFQSHIETMMRPDAPLEDHKGWAGKAPGAALRIAAVFHGVEHAHGAPWQHPINQKTMQNALDLLAPIIKHSTAVLGSMNLDNQQDRASRVLEWLLRKKPHGCTIRDIHGGLKSRLKTSNEVRAALEVLEDRGYVRVIEPSLRGVGRPPSPAVVVRPGLAK